MPFFQVEGRRWQEIFYFCTMDLFQRLRNRYSLSETALAALSAEAERLVFGRKECVVREGQRDDRIYFVEQGSVRTYVMREDRCVILNFAFEGDSTTSALGANCSEVSYCTVETLEPSVLICIPRQRMETLFGNSTELANWGRLVTEQMLRSHEEYFAEYSWRDKGEQYFRLLAEYPELLQRVPLKDLASYLFVTPQTLSRIRAELRRKLP